MEIEESWEDDWVDDAYEEDDYGGEDDDYTVECPECGADVYEDAEQCPVCGNYIIHTSSSYPWKDRPMWWIVIGVMGILAVLLSLAVLPAF